MLGDAPIPHAPRVIYGKNPLQEVLCQLRFPAILRIGTQEPVEFQELIREQFPEFREVRDGAGESIPETLQHLLGEISGISGTRKFQFRSADGVWTTTLAREFLAMSCLDYSNWEEFQERFDLPFKALAQIYRPAFFKRVGLRYQNAISRSGLGIGKIQWRELLKPHVSGILDTDAASHVSEIASQTAIALSDQGEYVRIRHGLREIEDSEWTYLIDCDYFTDERTGRNEAIQRLQKFNKYSGRVFRWCIKDALHDAMDPDGD